MEKLLDRSMFTLYVNFSLPCFDVHLHMKMKKKNKIVSSFQFLRRVVKEYRATMKEHYKAISLEFSKCQSFVFAQCHVSQMSDVVDAFVKGDQDQANKILEQEVRIRANNFQSIEFRFVPHQGNPMAHTLAKEGRRVDEPSVWVEEALR
ncbi:hypothetical protein PVK06_025833 [Gossypium arboreum]|uniref:RNase H type-1 domain-containing protein n=1 Tax=Gossypium arboreum TaxID=29729 RepID=A0ABR0NZE2_GOSAR|nr:hypothetical protein PVK06_025833 [Gossypium arboreum]